MSGEAKLSARPTCAVCGKPVERFTEEENELTQCIRFTAYCHGQRERIELPAEVAMACKSITLGVAFAPTRLLEPGHQPDRTCAR